MSPLPWQQALAVTFNSEVTTEIVMTTMSPSGICRKNTCWNGTAQATQASALMPRADHGHHGRWWAVTAGPCRARRP